MTIVRAGDLRSPSSAAVQRDDDLLVRAQHLDLAYGAVEVLRDASLEVRRGDFWFLLGGNGSGKTTFLRALLGIVPPRAGDLWLSPALRGRAGIGFVPQHCAINPSLPTTVREFVSLGLVGLPVARAERRARLDAALERVGLAPLVDRDYWSLSGGQRQRALVARGLIREPELLILDEPMNHLDPDAEEALLQDLLGLHRARRLALLLVTHDVAMAERHATHVATFAHGRVTVTHGPTSARGGA
jgi:ABC-type Mn2+/Zn2+ transport system ATPase subunit